jgi:outer membrane protein assembly factor BamB
MNRHLLVFGIIFLFLSSIVTPIVIGYHVTISGNNKSLLTDFNKDTSEHIWPMYKNNAQRTGLAEYDTSENPGVERWKYFIDSPLHSTPVIDKNGILYVATNSWEIHAIYPNGSMKWKRGLIGYTGIAPAIGPDGTIYVGTEKHFHAFYPNGTKKWIFNKSTFFCGDPVVDSDGIVYVGTSDGYLYAINPNGTLKWEYKINSNIRAPALDKQGNVYFTSRDRRLYCLSSNGSFKWKSEEITDFDYGPVIGDDGTIYVIPRWNWLFAFNPDGTEKWRTELSDSSGKPSFLPDGTLIICGQYSDINAINPSDGKVLWTYTVDDIPLGKWMTSAAIGNDGTIFFAYPKYCCALNPDGSLKWKTRLSTHIYPYDGLTVDSDPSIGSDETVYVTTWFYRGGSGVTDWGYVHAFSEGDPNAPSAPSIMGTTNIKPWVEYEYSFRATSPTGRDLYYFIDWGDGTYLNWTGPYASGEEVKIKHTWSWIGKYRIEARAKDSENLLGVWGKLTVTMPRDKATNNILFWRIRDQFPLLKEVLLRLILR